MNENDLIIALQTMPSNDDTNYTLKLKEFILRIDLESKKDVFYLVINSEQSIEIRFAAFYALIIYYRDFTNNTMLIELVDNYGSQFNNIKLYDIVLSLYYKNKIKFGYKEFGELAIRHAELACQLLPSNWTIKHHYAETVAFVAEEGINVSEDTINKALFRLDEALNFQKTNALFHSTKGRLLAQEKKYDEAIENLEKALRFEIVENKDSLIRIGQYNYYLLKVQMLNINHDLKKDAMEFENNVKKSNIKLEDLIKDVDDMKTRYLEYLSFFSSILAYIMITVNIAIKIPNFKIAVSLLLVLAGILIITFTLFRVLLPYTKQKPNESRKLFFCLSVAIILLIIGLLYGNDLFINTNGVSP